MTFSPLLLQIFRPPLRARELVRRALRSLGRRQRRYVQADSVVHGYDYERERESFTRSKVSWENTRMNSERIKPSRRHDACHLRCTMNVDSNTSCTTSMSYRSTSSNPSRLARHSQMTLWRAMHSEKSPRPRPWQVDNPFCGPERPVIVRHVINSTRKSYQSDYAAKSSTILPETSPLSICSNTSVNLSFPTVL